MTTYRAGENATEIYMMRQMLFGVGVFLVSSSIAWAGHPIDVGQGLGSAQPLASDVSLSPHFQGIEYLQVNDTNGTVHVAMGTANGTLIVLPVGSDAQNVSTPDAPLSVAVSGTETVYTDAQITLTVGVSASGALVWTAMPATSNPTASPDGNCDPNDCGINRGASPVPAMATSNATQASPEICDTNDCGINRVVKQISTTQTSASTQVTQATNLACDPSDCGINRQP
jgi:hypothetical protein